MAEFIIRNIEEEGDTLWITVEHPYFTRRRKYSIQDKSLHPVSQKPLWLHMVRDWVQEKEASMRNDGVELLAQAPVEQAQFLNTPFKPEDLQSVSPMSKDIQTLRKERLQKNIEKRRIANEALKADQEEVMRLLLEKRALKKQIAEAKKELETP